MDQQLSRSEQKRRAKGLEELAAELVELSANDIKRLPCDDLLKGEIKSTAAMKGPSLKRQLKFIAKRLREMDFEPLFQFLAEQKGSKLKQNKAFHELERLRDDIITEAFEAAREGEGRGDRLDASWQSEVIAVAGHQFPGLDLAAVKSAAIKYARSRKPLFSREIFRLLKAAMEKGHFAPSESDGGDEEESDG
jgi:ribosome-associated protein